MSGHSKWSTIKHKKAKTDIQKAKIFNKIGRELIVAVKEGGGADPNLNSKLKDCIAKAKSNNVPNENIERIIKKAIGNDDDTEYENIVYEGYGPNGVAIIVEALTDNRNRTAADIRCYFDKFGGNMGTPGCVRFMFSKKGVILIEKDNIDENMLMELSIESGAVDFVVDDTFFVIYTEPSNLNMLKEILEKKYKIDCAQIEMIPNTYIEITDEKSKLKIDSLLEFLENNDDVQEVWHNFENKIF